MIIVENDKEISDFVANLNLGFGAVKLDTDSLEFTKILTNDFYVISSNALTKVSDRVVNELQKVVGLAVYGSKNSSFDKFSNIIFTWNENTDKEVVKNQFTLLQDLISQAEVMRSQLISLNVELAQMTGALEHELIRLKRAHEKKTPKRLEEIKGISFYSKYSAGESMGGEFFDMFKTPGYVFILMSSTSSYLASSSILTFFTSLKMDENISDKTQVKFLKEIKREIEKINSSKDKPIDAHIITAVIDLNSYKVKGYKLGHFAFKSSLGREFPENQTVFSILDELEDGKFEIQLNRSEKLMLLSPGFESNWTALNSEFMAEDILTKPGIKSIDILDELFFQMKKDSESGFLNKDASVILLEVDRNVMVQI